MTAPSFELSPNARLLRQHLRKVRVGEQVSYDDLSAIISEKVDGACSALHSARRHLLRHDRILFSVIRTVGLQRLDDLGIVSNADNDIDRIRRRARTGVLNLACVHDFASMPPAKQLAHTTRMSIFTATAEMNSDRGIKKVDVVASGRAGELPIAETLRAFRKEWTV